MQLYLEDMATDDLMRTFDSLECDFRLSVPYIARVVVIATRACRHQRCSPPSGASGRWRRDLVLPPPWDERIDHLRVGIQPRDAVGSPGPLIGTSLHLEGVPRPWRIPPSPIGIPNEGIGLPGLAQSPTGRFAIKLTGKERPTRPASSSGSSTAAGGSCRGACRYRCRSSTR